MRRIVGVLLTSTLAAGAFMASAESASATIPAKYKNCTALNKIYPHGVGRIGARDGVRSTTSKPVTTFKRSTKIYNAAIKANKGLDRDKDGVACEKR